MDERRGKHFAGPTRRLGIVEFASSIPATREVLGPLQFFLDRGGQFASDTRIMGCCDTHRLRSRVCKLDRVAFCLSWALELPPAERPYIQFRERPKPRIVLHDRPPTKAPFFRQEPDKFTMDLAFL